MIHLQLKKDLSRDIKRGHPWVYQGALKAPLPPESGWAKLMDKKGQILAWGVYDAQSPLCFRVVSLERKPPSEKDLVKRLEKVLSFREEFFASESTTGLRCIHGEGDGFPGLICDKYGDIAVLQTDGQSLDRVWDLNFFANQIQAFLKVKSVLFKPQKGKGEPRLLCGDTPSESVEFLENGTRWMADIWKGQKTGFFLDQRRNRSVIQGLSEGRSVLNLFSYTGGFSIAAGRGGATHVTSVDISKFAIESCQRHWHMNGLDEESHQGFAMDVFEFLERQKNKFDIVIADPPSFASSRSHVEKATTSYTHVFSQAAKAVAPGGVLALSSCSSHIDFEMFYQISVDSVSKARRRARVISIQGQPEDHPFPLACPELRYLKFFLLRLD